MRRTANIFPMATSSNRYVSELLASKDEHLDKIHRIIHKSLSEDSLVTQKISEVEKDSQRREKCGQTGSLPLVAVGNSFYSLVLFSWGG
ncbi:hypothetical protein [Planobacterium oryzisoli]|uniref:hypothetical protein n=1 Tax=Planobacterium oryzisoli TaxID=2771435 RepID=UPI001E3125AB|nr:hypothetical protein [Planobacterium oryzisoli]